MAKFHWFPLRFGVFRAIFPPKSRIFEGQIAGSNRPPNRPKPAQNRTPSRPIRPPGRPKLAPGPASQKLHFLKISFGHIFWLRTPFFVFFGSFRSYGQGLHHQHGWSIIYHHQNSWASTKLLQQRVKNVDERYNFSNLYPLPFLCEPHYIFAITMSYWG
jgi:hypothetical protein